MRIWWGINRVSNRTSDWEWERERERMLCIDVYESSIGAPIHRYPSKQYSTPKCRKYHRISMFSVNYTLPPIVPDNLPLRFGLPFCFVPSRNSRNNICENDETTREKFRTFRNFISGYSNLNTILFSFLYIKILFLLYSWIQILIIERWISL